MLSIPGVFGKIGAALDFVGGCERTPAGDSFTRWIQEGVAMVSRLTDPSASGWRSYSFISFPDPSATAFATGMMVPSADAAGRAKFPFCVFHTFRLDETEIPFTILPGLVQSVWHRVPAVLASLTSSPTQEEYYERLAREHRPTNLMLGRGLLNIALKAMRESPVSRFLGGKGEDGANHRRRICALAWECAAPFRNDPEVPADFGVKLPWMLGDDAGVQSYFWSEFLLRYCLKRPRCGYSLLVPGIPDPPPAASEPSSAFFFVRALRPADFRAIVKPDYEDESIEDLRNPAAIDSSASETFLDRAAADAPAGEVWKRD